MKLQIPCLNIFSYSRKNSIDNSCHITEETEEKKFRVFSHSELKGATDNFHSSNKLGQGAFGVVFRGRLRDESAVAVKVVSVEAESMRGEREFIAELAALSDVRHENLVSLRGCCVDGAKRFLVYDYMENNSLSHTFLGGKRNRSKFDWETRREVSLGIARGLAYLHEEVKPHIVHRDIKPSNILLDCNFKPQVGDFGLSKLLRENRSHISTRVAGTIGYLAPEYAITGRLTRKSDVYSFGVLLLEIVTGKEIVTFNVQVGEHYLVHKAWESYKAKNLEQLVDSVLFGTNNFSEKEEKEAVRFIKVGLLCVQENARLRPGMSMVIKMLNGEFGIGENDISQPGLVTDLMAIKIGQNRSSSTFTSLGSQSPNTYYF